MRRASWYVPPLPLPLPPLWPFKPQYQDVCSPYYSTYICYGISWENLLHIKTCYLWWSFSLILLTCMCELVVMISREIRCLSLLRLKGLSACHASKPRVWILFNTRALSLTLYIRFSFHVFDERQSFSVKKTQKIIDESLTDATNVRKKMELQTKTNKGSQWPSHGLYEDHVVWSSI